MAIVHTTDCYSISAAEFAAALQSLGLPKPPPGETIDYRVELVSLRLSGDNTRCAGDMVGEASEVRVTVRRYQRQ